jgi:hypothetical protein
VVEDGEVLNEPVGFTSDYGTHLGVYEVDLSGDTPVVDARFYLGKTSSEVVDGRQIPWYERFQIWSAKDTSAICTRNTLAIRCGKKTVAYCFFVTALSSFPVYQTVECDEIKTWCISECNAYAGFFPRYMSHWCDVHGSVECGRFDELDDCQLSEIPLHADLVEIKTV